MNQSRFPYLTLLLSLATVLASGFVAIKVGGHPWSTVSITSLNTYGGLTLELLRGGQWWRILTSQLVHVKQGHMVLNVTLLFILSYYIEQTVGFIWLLSLWLVGGGVGTFVSTLVFVSPPWNVGSGASQAIMSMAAFIFVLQRKRYPVKRWATFTVIASIAINLILDLISAGYPKPGKIAGFFMGLLIAWILVSIRKSSRTSAVV